MQMYRNTNIGTVLKNLPSEQLAGTQLKVSIVHRELEALRNIMYPLS